MAEPVTRQTRYVPAAPPPQVPTSSIPIVPTKAIHLRLDPETVRFLALARLESGATVETLIEAVLTVFRGSTPAEQQMVYKIARDLAERRKQQGLSKRRHTYREQDDMIL
ncbi:hypothetical protein [Candidatus Cyanaurora vandensis]|uniref:hypothetical protein n=1 Tax=Candidatus Cyanaurora vandensis TaxID=2714958 RepID=UPI00257DB64D|nr:hypothetical protein [Candidatus Cyanaurora vandensis]